jgi:hypothetical protein
MTHIPHPTQRTAFTFARGPSIASAWNWQELMQASQPLQRISSTSLTNAELATTLAIPNSAMPRRMPHEQVQQLQM